MSDAFEHEVYFLHNFMPKFLQDLGRAKARVLLQSAFLKPRRVETLSPALVGCHKRYVRVCVFAATPEEPEPLFETALRMLHETGAHVTLRAKVHEKLAVIDEMIAWDGSLNALSFRDKSERMTRWISRKKAVEIIASHRLDTCEVCLQESLGRTSRELLGAAIARRRLELGMTQRDLAEIAGVSQRLVSEVEAGRRDFRFNAIERINAALNLGIRSMPNYLLPCVDLFVDRRLQR